MSGGDSEYIPATMCYAAKHETNFAEMDMDTMKAMVKASNPGEVHNVSQGWKDVHNQLVGGSGGGIKGAFDAAVEEVLQHWEGDSAEKFKAQADKISKKISDCSLYADYTSTAMKNAANVLGQLKPEVESMEKPSTANKAVNWLEDGGSRDDTGLKRDLSNPGMTTQQALDNNSGSLSAGKEQQLRMAVKMEQLGAAYVSQAKSMGTWTKRNRDDHEDYPGTPGEPPSVVPMPVPSGGSTGPKQVGPPSFKPTGKGPGFSPGDLQSPKTPGISGGISPQPGKGSFTPDVHTGLDGLNPPKGGGIGGTGGGGGGIGGGGGGLNGGIGGGAGGGSGSGGGIGGGGLGGGGGIGGGMGMGRGGGAGGGAGAGARGAGRAGMPGMGGGAGAGKGAGGKGAGAGRGGALARQKGGVIGSGSGKASGAGQGGSGLHRSRGGAQAGAGAGGRRPAGMAGAPGAHGAKGKEKGQNNGERPDYLVEDEETWASERNVAPKVIE
ncbi:hypothetical protein [Streptomyces pinistramenti]|uniref:hypothetical protein n=1 Tax=Streptomyces pinistramenti TaxID=2884812 RepID=UPI00222175A8|nr:hypothetical protein [Streptomyces pinistramenti]